MMLFLFNVRLRNKYDHNDDDDDDEVCVSLSGGITVTANLHCKALTRGKRAALK